MKKADSFYDIQDAVAFDHPIDNNHPFYTDFSNLRKGFSEKKLFKLLNINPKTAECHPISEPKRIFLSGHRGTGKTSELLKVQNLINETKCYLVVFSDLSDEELDVNNIDFVDVLILIIEKLVEVLSEKNISIDSDTLESFYSWYNDRILEINESTDASASIETEVKAGIDIPALFSLISKTKAKLQASEATKETIRRVFTNKFSDFSLKFNQFVLKIREIIQEQHIAKDILFIIDGFEKIGTLEDRKKILIDNANRFTSIRSNMLITLPIELTIEAAKIREFGTPVNFPIISLNEEAIKKFTEFIKKRVNQLLLDDDATKMIIEYGAGSPRETLRVINEAYVQAEEEVLDIQSIQNAIKVLGDEKVNLLTDEDIDVLKELTETGDLTYSDTLAKLLFNKVVLDDGEKKIINPIVKENSKFQTLIAK